MPATSPTTPPPIAPETPVEPKKIDLFHPEMPNIPGLNSTPEPSVPAPSAARWSRPVQIGGIGGAVALAVLTSLWLIKSRSPASSVPNASDSSLNTPSVPDLPIASSSLISKGPTIAATVDELSKPWTSKKFTFVRPLTNENIEAMVIRIPGVGLWAFALQEPYGKCNLEFVKDLGQIAKQYGYHATHPMVVNSCNGTVYDPLKVGPLGSNTWVRGEIVQGSALRPPVSINVETRGRSIVADRIE